ncbi:hypothetical protein QP028_10975 [Corynebacterium suedekumii]|nr:hypothetical protein QP028_10975 [Corynebacterium suedekumii]
MVPHHQQAIDMSEVLLIPTSPTRTSATSPSASATARNARTPR